MVPSFTTCKSTTTMLSSLNSVLLLFLLLGASPSVSSETCEEHFKESNSCPTLPSSYKKLNDLCCGIKNGKLHCVSTHTQSHNGVSRAIYGCFDETVIPAGFAMNISLHSPQEKQLVPCEVGSFEPENRSSIYVRHDYCTRKKSKCSGPKQMRICQGGPTADDQCGCADEYEPHDKTNRESFTDNHFADCQKKPCPSGSARQVNRTAPPTCPFNSTVLLDYTCHPVPSTAASSPTPPTESTTPKTSVSNANNLQWLNVLWGIPVIITVIIIIVLIKNKERVTKLVKKMQGFQGYSKP